MYWRISLFAAMLAAAGIPLYIHLPRYAATDLGLSLSTVGAVLIGIRLMDFLQDPLLGRLADRWPEHRKALAATGVVGMAAGFLMLFVVPPLTAPTLWLVLSLVLLFTAFSLANILFYAQGVVIAGKGPAVAHYRLAGFRETGMLAGVVLAAIAPSALKAMGAGANTYRDFGLLLAALTLGVGLVTVRLWSPSGARLPEPLPFVRLFTPDIARLLLLALVNALPVAITSTLFLFFVEDRLALAGMSGPFLLVFFFSAGVSAPVWSRLVRRHGPKRVLVPAMVLAIAGF
ncbi:MAG: MFS transporter, partial [Paracoccaceae bacterium]